MAGTPLLDRIAHNAHVSVPAYVHNAPAYTRAPAGPCALSAREPDLCMTCPPGTLVRNLCPACQTAYLADSTPRSWRERAVADSLSRFPRG
jgi:hypothetical protein